MDNLLSAPIYRAILFPPLVFGMPRKLFMLIAISSMALVLSLAQWWFLVVTVFLLIVARRVSKEDRWVFDVYTQFLKLPSVLD